MSAMIFLTEQQRLDALKACEGIEAANAKLQQACANILEILDRMSQPPQRSGDRDTRTTSTAGA